MARWSLIIAVLVALKMAAAFDCYPCAADPGISVCCACCVAGVFQPGRCNAVQYQGCDQPQAASSTVTAFGTPDRKSVG